MIVPTETESRSTLDAYANVMLKIADEIQNEPELVLSAPNTTPVSRLDEVAANRKPNVRWRPA